MTDSTDEVDQGPIDSDYMDVIKELKTIIPCLKDRKALRTLRKVIKYLEEEEEF
jgi:predicted AAA+ superfamily ATPase